MSRVFGVNVRFMKVANNNIKLVNQVKFPFLIHPFIKLVNMGLRLGHMELKQENQFFDGLITIEELNNTLYIRSFQIPGLANTAYGLTLRDMAEIRMKNEAIENYRNDDPRYSFEAILERESGRKVKGFVVVNGNDALFESAGKASAAFLLKAREVIGKKFIPVANMKHIKRVLHNAKNEALIASFLD